MQSERGERRKRPERMRSAATDRERSGRKKEGTGEKRRAETEGGEKNEP